MRIGIIGTNFISDWFVAAARQTYGRVDPVAVYSRTAERAQEFAQKHDIPQAYDDYEAMLANVDAVYIASPTFAHFSQAMTAIEAGRHVLVEKTMTASVAEAEALFAAAEERGVVAMEATRHLHTPAYALLAGTLDQLGPLRYAHFEKLQYSSRYDRFRAGEHLNAFDPSLGNSALADIGVYCLEPALDLFGIPRHTSGTSIRLDNGFEAGGSLQLDYATMIVDVVYSKIASGVGPCTIIGEKGIVTVNDLAEPCRIVVQKRGEDPVVFLDTDPVTPGEAMSYELEAFADQVEAEQIDLRWRDVTIASRRIMDEQLARTGT